MGEYNPITLFGSWLGVVVAMFIGSFIVGKGLVLKWTGCGEIAFLCGIATEMFVLFTLWLGFLFGWIIHYIIRKSGNRRKMASIRRGKR